ncbi:MAG: TIGR03619 family F420-dependent LLM class oxidoreductase [Acidimicrobiales bacterium]|nr:TIGR03619 family F420-dependent LLM class oxidoreductase [Acidimicrobiales bacterium]MDG2217642.1 TIGR03619 family F420-dependent LLM class oxidoreductase [Acidimicrobiales bacterium]
MAAPRLLMILTENEPLIDLGDLDAMVELARIADTEGFDAVMLSEHLALGPAAGALGRPTNPREYAAPGNQDPAMGWPSQIVMASAIAAATENVRIVLGAIIAPLRHPVAMAKELATLDRLSHGRLVVQPTVSWHREEYDALGVDFTKRGRILDEQLEALMALWSDTPAEFHGEFFDFAEVYSMPKPMGLRPTMWFGGQAMHDPLLRRIVKYGDAFHPFGSPSADDLAKLTAGMTAAGRDISELEQIGGTRARFTGADDVADIDASMADFPDQLAAGYTTFCMKPAQHVNTMDEVPALCRRMVDHVATF